MAVVVFGVPASHLHAGCFVGRVGHVLLLGKMGCKRAGDRREKGNALDFPLVEIQIQVLEGHGCVLLDRPQILNGFDGKPEGGELPAAPMITTAPAMAIIWFLFITLSFVDREPPWHWPQRSG